MADCFYKGDDSFDDDDDDVDDDDGCDGDDHEIEWQITFTKVLPTWVAIKSSSDSHSLTIPDY